MGGRNASEPPQWRPPRSASTDPPSSRFGSPAKKKCVEKDEACYIYYMQATYEDRRTLNGELIVGLCFQRKVSKKFPQGKDLPFPSEEKIEQLKKEVMQGGTIDGHLEHIETTADKKASDPALCALAGRRGARPRGAGAGGRRFVGRGAPQGPGAAPGGHQNKDGLCKVNWRSIVQSAKTLTCS